MKFKLDENLSADGAKFLAGAGHDAATALQEQLAERLSGQLWIVEETRVRIRPGDE
jgi:hypothetical protein